MKCTVVLYRKAEYTDKDRNELEQQIMTLKSQIRANEFILSSRYSFKDQEVILSYEENKTYCCID